MKNLLLILSLSFVFVACHTKEEQAQSGINDPINLIYKDIDSSVVSLNGPKAKAPAPVATPDTSAAASNGCIDSSKIQADAMCTQEFMPVCGCDGKEYGNQCQAEKAGVTTWTDGPCAKKESKKATTKAPAKTTSKAEPEKETKKDKKKKKK